ncbi:MAG TPA: Uma2 family endonuclease [Chitinophagales bacterium]|nr:Uma2 family endonuclease [Chitinophagales bacterium]
MESILKKNATKEDYMNLPEGAPYQLINGALVMSPAPKANHQRVLLDIATQIRNFLVLNNIGIIIIAPMDVHLDEENIYQPDLLFISKNNKHCKIKDWVYGAPDIIFEVLSEFNSYNDTGKKFRMYEQYGVREYFIIDPNNKEAIFYKNMNNKFIEIYKEAGIVRSEILGVEVLF